MRRMVIVGGVMLALLAGAPAAASVATDATRLTITTGEQARQGEPHEVTVRVTDARGAPLAGRSVTLWEQLRFFDYRDMARVADARTDHRGVATVAYTPAAAGSGQLLAEFAGDDTYAASSARTALTVQEGAAVGTRVAFVRPDPLLPRGVTAFWFLPLLAGVWLAIATSIYHLVRIPGERQASQGA